MNEDQNLNATADDAATPDPPQDGARLVAHDDFSPEYEKFVDLAIGAREDAARFYQHGNKEAGVRMRQSLVQMEKYGKWLRLDSIALAKGDPRPEPFDWGDL